MKARPREAKIILQIKSKFLLTANSKLVPLNGPLLMLDRDQVNLVVHVNLQPLLLRLLLTKREIFTTLITPDLMATIIRLKSLITTVLMKNVSLKTRHLPSSLARQVQPVTCLLIILV